MYQFSILMASSLYIGLVVNWYQDPENLGSLQIN